MWPLLNVSIDPNSEADAVALQTALAKLSAEDPALAFQTDAETGQTILGGMSESHLDFTFEVLQQLYKAKVTLGHKQVAYREIIGCKAEIKYTHKIVRGRPQYAEVTMIFEPLGLQEGILFENKAGNAVPREYLPAIENGIRVQAETGVLAGFPTVDFKCTLIDGKYHDIDSSPLAFEIAAKACFRELRRVGSAKIIEPVMKVEVLSPSRFIPEVTADLNKRLTHVQETSLNTETTRVTALVPLAQMSGYASNLLALTRGQAQFTMQYDHHGEVERPKPPDDTFPSAIALRA